MAGQVLRAYRTLHGITQKQLANELGVEARTLRMYENGERALENITELQRIAALLAIDPEELGLSARMCDTCTPAQIYEVVERVWSLIPQARLSEAHTTIDALLCRLQKAQKAQQAPSSEDHEYLHAWACAHNVAGYVKSMVCKVVEAGLVSQHFQEAARIACSIDDQTLLNIALSQYAELLRRQNKIQQCLLYLEKARIDTPHAHALAQSNNARLLARAYLHNKDFDGFERQMQRAEELARSASEITSNTLTLHCLLQYPQTDRRKSSNFVPLPDLPDMNNDTRTVPKRSSDLALGMVYEEYGRGYGRAGKLEKSLHYLELAATHLPAHNLWDMLLKAARAEALIYSGAITEGMRFAVEVAHLAQMYGHQWLLERLYYLQCYLDDQALLMSRASRSLNDVLHGQVEA
jgi:transcriptional regulator with XRE-family HTH domain